MEQTDNRKTDFDSLLIHSDTRFEILPGDSIQNQLCLINAIQNKTEYLFLPYYAWDNREPGRMIVWVPFLSEGMKEMRKNQFKWQNANSKYQK